MRNARLSVTVASNSTREVAAAATTDRIGLARRSLRGRLRISAAVGVGLAYVLLTIATMSGLLAPLDEAVIHHVTKISPGLSPGPRTMLEPADFTTAWSTLNRALEFPASPAVSVALAAGCCWLLLRQRRWQSAFAWLGVWVAATMIEIACKIFLSRPMLDVTVSGVHLQTATFARSFPSGHVLRAVLIAGAIASLSPRIGLIAMVWAASLLPFRVWTGAHTPTDVIGGVLMGMAAVAFVYASARNEVRVTSPREELLQLVA
jgi:undecaprenyl-diphosphatase